MQPGSNIKCLWSGLLCLLIFTGCGSLSKDAKHLMETGNYNAAIGLWDQVITKDPNDAEARFYRNLAQSQLLNEDLVTLKGLIDTRQTLIAFDQLKKFHQKRTQWGLGMNPNSSLYLKTQTERLYVRYLEMARQALDQNQVLRALWLEKQYRPLLDITPNEDEIKIKKDTQALGEKKCGTLDAESRTLADLRRYAVQYCKRFGKDLRPIESLERSILADQAQLKGVELKVERLNPSKTETFL